MLAPCRCALLGLGAGGSVIEVGGVLQLMGLLETARPRSGAVAQAVHADAAGEIQILLASGPAQAVVFQQSDGLRL